jgi:hypothetical protein
LLRRGTTEAACVTLQDAMDLGEPIFDVAHHDGEQNATAAKSKQTSTNVAEAAQMP